MNRVLVVGVTASGKSTFGAELAELMDAAFIELDALHWQPNWTPQDPALFEQVVDDATRAPRWVAAGGYSQVRHLTWRRAELLVWLDYSFPRVFWQLTTRTFRRIWTQEQLWNGNRERFRNAFMSKNSLFVWLFQTYWSRPKRYEERLRTEFPDLPVLRFKRPSDARKWLESV